MQDHLFEPLGRPVVLIVLGSLFGLLVALGRALSPLSLTSDPLYFGLTSAVGAILVLSILTLAHDTISWFFSPEQAPSS